MKTKKSPLISDEEIFVSHTSKIATGIRFGNFESVPRPIEGIKERLSKLAINQTVLEKVIRENVEKLCGSRPGFITVNGEEYRWENNLLERFEGAKPERTLDGHYYNYFEGVVDAMGRYLSVGSSFGPLASSHGEFELDENGKIINIISTISPTTSCF